MLLTTSATDAIQRSRQIEVNGRQYTLAEYVGAVPKKVVYVEGNEVNDNGLPQAFLVIQPPGAVTPAHFHEPKQFQVFVEGDGRIGAHTTTPPTVQYANGHTPYGPIWRPLLASNTSRSANAGIPPPSICRPRVRGWGEPVSRVVSA